MEKQTTRLEAFSDGIKSYKRTLSLDAKFGITFWEKSN